MITHAKRPLYYQSEYEYKDTEALKASLSEILAITAESIARAATIISILEDRGEDLSQLKIGLMGYLRRVACGQVLPDVVARFMGSSVLRHVSCLPIQDQQRCLSMETVKLATVEHGNVDTREKPIMLLDPSESRQVFARDHIRDVAEQASWLRSQQYKTATFDSPIEPPPYTVVGNALVVTRPVRLTRRDLERLLESMK